MNRIAISLLFAFVCNAAAVDVINALPSLQVVQGDTASFTAQFGGSPSAVFEARDSRGQPLGQVIKGDSSGNLVWTYNSGMSLVGQQQVELVTIESGSISDRRKLILQVVEATPRQKWLQQNFGQSSEISEAQDLADPDGDGKSNLEEFAFGLNPKSAADSKDFMTVQNDPSVNGSGKRAVFNRLKNYNAAAVDYKIEFSSNLSNWYTSAATPDVIADDGTLQKVVLSFPLLPDGSAAQFFRVKISRTADP